MAGNLEGRLTRLIKERTTDYEETMQGGLGGFRKMMQEFEERINGKVSEMKGRTERLEKR